ncbi:hypothetical protein GWR56_07865 [Mucilaginibacter sp. 14171R-50]|uniref:hypothetical protein n=1 Tax=Mucilaginibacter sp. 14171R-50 TaxID=2703789 RepID=UPI00138D81E5|nr:hypothetical protein [Mucilaginibacter sp. 14171R-50]QHS55458.1 hypothetical protein GWR56_07865 [Mucilaginibacter sp. 14171R-50]
MNINDLKYYVRFVFNCSDGLGFSTDSADHIKNCVKGQDGKSTNEQFNIGDEIVIIWDEYGERSYTVSEVEIRDIRYDTDEKLYGVHLDDRGNITDTDRFSFMTIFVSLTAVEEKMEDSDETVE